MRWIKGANRLCNIVLYYVPLIAVALFTSAQSAAGQNAPSTVAPPSERPFFVLIDPAHGGSDSGAQLTATTPEKEVTLALARRLRQELGLRGIECRLLRDGDITLSSDQRAAAVNSAAPALYIAVHVSSVGNGIRVFTAMLPVSGDSQGAFVDWNSAQALSLQRSKVLQQQFVAAIQKTGFPVRGLIAPLRPLNNVKAPALGIEIAPTTGVASQLALPGYQQMICAAVANALAAMAPLRARSGGAP
jgi:N-acetylmuramoyl-L-alanine amidase